VRCVELTQNCEWITRSIFVKKIHEILAKSAMFAEQVPHNLANFVGFSLRFVHTEKSREKFMIVADVDDNSSYDEYCIGHCC